MRLNQEQRYKSALDRLRLSIAEFNYYKYDHADRTDRTVSITNGIKRLETAERSLTAIYDEMRAYDESAEVAS